MERKQLHYTVRRFAAPAIKRAVLAASGGTCAFPGCGRPMLDASGTPILEIACIGHLADEPDGERSDLDNLLVLCPNHHALVDRNPIKYTTEWLRQIKKEHEAQVKAAQKPDVQPSKVDMTVPEAFRQALCFWSDNRRNPREEDWQELFTTHPHIIAQAVPDHLVQIGSKYYVGGKDVTNSGGNLVDFLYTSKISRNVSLVEIKTPTMKLVGSQYRAKAYSMTEELSGSIVQVLNYKLELQRNYFSLLQGRSHQIEAFDPQCLVIAGDLEKEDLDPLEERSFELFRAGLGCVRVITFDEVFGKLRDLVDMLG